MNNTNPTSLDDFYPNQTFPDNSYEPFISYCWIFEGEANLFTLIMVSICLPLTFLALCALLSQLRNEHVAPVYVINLVFADILQMCCMIVKLAGVKDELITTIFYYYVYNCAVMVSVFSMVCIALERYLLIAWPIWYHLKRTTKVYVGVCALIWVISVFIGVIHQDYLGAFLLLPFPLLIFFLVGTIRALSAVQCVSTNEKRRIVAILLVVVLTYTVLFLPRFVWPLLFLSSGMDFKIYVNFYDVSCTLIQLQPLTNLVLYFLFNKWTIGRFLVCLTCCRKNNDDTTRSTD